MREQLEYLVEMSRRPNITVEVVPFSAGGHYALLGAFALVEQAERRIGYMETISEGYIVERPATLAWLGLAFDTVRGETLSRAASRDFIMRRAEGFGSD